MASPSLISVMARRKIYSKTAEPLDQWLESQGFYRKHVARDGYSLFRAVSEQVLSTQSDHHEVRRQCVEFMNRNMKAVEQKITVPFDDYIANLQNGLDVAGKLELEIISTLYERDVLIFEEIGKSPIYLTANGLSRKIVVALSPENHYDPVYLNSYIIVAGFCQSLVYSVLYSRVFNLKEVSYAVEKMLQKQAPLKKNEIQYTSTLDTFTSTDLAECPQTNLTDDFLNNMKNMVDCGIIPFPYKVAKALDPNIYRNIEFDAWNDLKRDQKFGKFIGDELQVGVKCKVKLHSERSFNAYIQEMEKDKGSVVVFVEELGKMCTVNFDLLEPIPKTERVIWPFHVRRGNNNNLTHKQSEIGISEFGNKWKKSKILKSRKIKDVMLPISNKSGNNNRMLPSEIAQQNMRIFIDQQATQVKPVAYHGYLSGNINKQHNYNTVGNEGPVPVILDVDINNQSMSRNCTPRSILMQVPSSTSECEVKSLAVQINCKSNNYSEPPPLPDSTSQFSHIDKGSCDEISSTSQIPVFVPCSVSYTNPKQDGESSCDTIGSCTVQSADCSTSYVLCDTNVGQINSRGSSSQLKETPGNIVLHPVNLLAQKSVMIDGSDLPFTDIPTLRFFFNLGYDFLHQFMHIPIVSHQSSKGLNLQQPATQQNEVSSSASTPTGLCAQLHSRSPQQTVESSQQVRSEATSISDDCCGSEVTPPLQPANVYTANIPGSHSFVQPYWPIYSPAVLPYYILDGDPSLLPIPLPCFPHTNVPVMPQQQDVDGPVPNSSVQSSTDNRYYPTYTYLPTPTQSYMY